MSAGRLFWLSARLLHRWAARLDDADHWCSRRQRRRSGEAGRIVVTPGVLSGAPRIAGTRLAVDCIQALDRSEYTVSAIVRLYPYITHEDVLAALDYEVTL